MLDLVVKTLKVDRDDDARPWNVLKPLFKFRNSLAHGRTETLVFNETVALSKLHESTHEVRLASWEEFCTRENAERAREDVFAIVCAIYGKMDDKSEHPFMGCTQETWKVSARSSDPDILMLWP